MSCKDLFIEDINCDPFLDIHFHSFANRDYVSRYMTSGSIVESYIGCQDVLVISPTGSGKCLTFHLLCWTLDMVKEKLSRQIALPELWVAEVKLQLHA